MTSLDITKRYFERDFRLSQMPSSINVPGSLTISLFNGIQFHSQRCIPSSSSDMLTATAYSLNTRIILLNLRTWPLHVKRSMMLISCLNHLANSMSIFTSSYLYKHLLALVQSQVIQHLISRRIIGLLEAFLAIYASYLTLKAS